MNAWSPTAKIEPKICVKEFRKTRIKPTDSFIVKLKEFQPEFSKEVMDSLRKMMPEKWRGIMVCLGPNDDVEQLSLPAARDLFLRLKTMLEQDSANEIMIGQIWESRDKRDTNSKIEILQVASTLVIAKRLKTGLRTSLGIDLFKSGRHGRYKLVSNP